MANILFERQLGSTHSSLSTIFFVVLAYIEIQVVSDVFEIYYIVNT